MNSSSSTLSVKQLDKKKSQFLYTDEMLISRFQSGDENAYVELVNRYKDKLTNFVFYFLKDEEHSEDVVQETFIRLYEKKHYYKEIAKFSTWIYTIARNQTNTELRKKKRKQTLSLSRFGKNEKDYELAAIQPRIEKEFEDKLFDLPISKKYIQEKNMLELFNDIFTREIK